jgi:3-oxoacyl-[acyl-carrier-protein] synthase II
MSSSRSTPTDWPNDATGVNLAVMRALKFAGLTPGDVDMIQAAGNGGKNPDAIEADAYLHLFGSEKKTPVVSSVKGALGESFSSGGIRASALALSISNGIVPPTLGLVDPIARLSFVMGKARNMDIRNGLVNAVSYGGTNVSVVMRKMTAL